MERDEPRKADGPAVQRAKDADLAARLKRLEVQLDQVRDTEPAPGSVNEQANAGPSFLGRAFRLSTEFIAGVLAGFGLGWLFDRWLGTSPWGLIAFLLLGFGAGIYNVMRAAGFVRPASGSDGGSGS
jgi:ATP synthase protein I